MFRNMARWVLLGAALALLAAPAARADYEAGRKAWGAGRHAEAVAEWRGAAAGGDARAMLALGRAYLKGLGVPQDYVLAHMWFNLSASRGEARALKERDALSSRMTPAQVASAQDRARAWRPGGQAAAPPAAPSSPTPAGPPPKRALAEAQGLLNALGYQAGAPDGIWGRRSVQAYRAFLRDSGLPPAESLTPDALRAMRKAARGKPASKPVRRTPKPAADLHRIVKAGDIDGLKKALAGKNAKVNARDARGWTPLMHAANKGYALLVPPLLKAGADPNIRLADGATALFMAAVHGRLEVVDILIKAGADPKITGPNGRTAVDVIKTKYGAYFQARNRNVNQIALSILKGHITVAETAKFIDNIYKGCGIVGRKSNFPHRVRVSPAPSGKLQFQYKMVSQPSGYAPIKTKYIEWKEIGDVAIRPMNRRRSMGWLVVLKPGERRGKTISYCSVDSGREIAQALVNCHGEELDRCRKTGGAAEGNLEIWSKPE